MSAPPTPPETFSQAVERMLGEARRGSDALAALLMSYQDLLEGMARARVPEHLRAKVDPLELVQETLLWAHRRFSSFKGQAESQWRAWLCRILTRRAANAVRSFNTDKRDAGREVRIDDSQASMDLGERLVADNTTPSAAAAREEEKALLLRALVRLSKVEQAVIKLAQVNKWPFNQVGELFGMSEAAVQKCYTRALVKLHSALAALQEGGAGPLGPTGVGR